MATAVDEAPPMPAAHPQDHPAEPKAQVPQRHGHKSWRKKYYKMRHQFQKLMARNNSQFDDEQKAMRMARRLQEQNDQLLDMLYDLNKAPRLPTQLRYDIRSPVPSIGDPIFALDNDELELEDSLSYNPMRVLSRLETVVPHSSMSDLPTDPQMRKELEDFFNDDEPTGYLSPAHEEDYLAAIDAHEPNALNENTNRIHVPSGPWSARDPSIAAAKNPVSVYNWLRKHNPDLLETSEKGAGRDGGGASASAAATKEEKAAAKVAPTKVMPKRASVGARHEYGEVLDDDGNIISGGKEEGTPSGPGRGRKRALADDDGAYRPKGGNTGGRKKKQKVSIGEKAAGLSVVSAPNENASERE